MTICVLKKLYCALCLYSHCRIFKVFVLYINKSFQTPREFKPQSSVKDQCPMSVVFFLGTKTRTTPNYTALLIHAPLLYQITLNLDIYFFLFLFFLFYESPWQAKHTDISKPKYFSWYKNKCKLLLKQIPVRKFWNNKNSCLNITFKRKWIY